MGKPKKGKGKQPESDPSEAMESLSLTAPHPVATGEDSDVGITGCSKERRQKKKEAKAKAKAEAKHGPIPESEPTTSMSEPFKPEELSEPSTSTSGQSVSAKVEAEDDDASGLNIGATKRTRRRKGKVSLAAQEALAKEEPQAAPEPSTSHHQSLQPALSVRSYPSSYGPSPQQMPDPRSSFGPPPQRVPGPGPSFGPPPQRVPGPGPSFGPPPQRVPGPGPSFRPPPQRVPGPGPSWGPPPQQVPGPGPSFRPPPQRVPGPGPSWGPPPQQVPGPGPSLGPPPQRVSGPRPSPSPHSPALCLHGPPAQQGPGPDHRHGTPPQQMPGPRPSSSQTERGDRSGSSDHYARDDGRWTSSGYRHSTRSDDSRRTSESSQHSRDDRRRPSDHPRKDSERSAPQPQPLHPGEKCYSIPTKRCGAVVPCRQTNVLTNYLPMVIKPIKVHRYDVAMTPDRPKKFLGQVFNTMMRDNFPGIVVAYDQNKIAFSVRELPGGITSTHRKSFRVEFPDDNGKYIVFEVSLKKAGIVDYDTIIQYMRGGTSLNPPTEAIQVIDVVLRQGSLEKYVKAGRTFFMRPSNPVDLSDGLEMWTGLFQSAIFTSRAFVNIDVAHKGFPKAQSMIDVLRTFEFDPAKPVEEQRRGNIIGLRNFLKGLRVVAKIGGDQSSNCIRREFICNDVVDPPYKKNFTFTDKDGANKTMSVAEYFVKEKSCKLLYPNLNCLWVGAREKTIFYPMELLEVAYGQVANKQLTERQLSTMVRVAATAPDIRKAKIEEVIRSMNYSRNKYFEHFGLQISETFTQVPAKILNPPPLEYSNQVVEPRNGSWNFRRLFQGVNLRSWGVMGVHLDARQCNAESAIAAFKSTANEIGMSMSDPIFCKYNVVLNQIEKTMRDAYDYKLQLLFVIVPGRGLRDAYSKVKQFAERRVGILTQCVKDSTLYRINKQTIRNILLKVNSKLMGINQCLESRNLPQSLRGGSVMVVGADVTHPSPDQNNIPSIAAVAASIDIKCYQYNIGLSIQTPKKEMIVDFEDIMVDHLKIYKERLRKLPDKIYVFRDGVSEGQFSQVMQSELRAIYRAHERLSGGAFRPQVLFILVQKRHHTRMFTVDRLARNVEPGTVVDTEVVHPRELDFYLVSHQAIKGTARPTRYHAVCNDGDMAIEEVEQLAFYLCHLYSRCTRSVSYPTPTYYAHLACLRARVLTQGERFDLRDLEKRSIRLTVLERMLSNSRMFYI